MNAIIKYRLWLLLALPFLFASCKKDKVQGHNNGSPIIIEKFSPMKGGTGAEILVYGDNFNNDTTGVTVLVNGVRAVVTGTVANRLIFLVPEGAGSGKITISVNGTSATSTQDFNYLPAQYVSTMTGSGIAGYKDGDSATARFNFQYGQGMTHDAAGNLYITDGGNNNIRKITPDGKVTTVAGSNTSGGYWNGPVAEATFNHPYGIEIDKDNNIYVADTWNGALRKISADGMVSLVAWVGDITDVAIDKRNGKVYVAQFGPGKILEVDPINGNLTEVASGFQNLSAIEIDSKGNFYGVDNSRSFIGRVDAASKQMTVIAGAMWQTGLVDGQGTAAKFDHPWGIAIDKNDNLYIGGNGGASYGGGDNNTNQCIRFIEANTWNVTTYAGSSSKGYADGLASLSLFNVPVGLTVDDKGVVYVMDAMNYRIRKIISR
ncbi:MAG: IPT/TIG domain-containing protein [Chitinophaga sp.]|uniref:IPT/TIG domain-containing protein n=1 Tax=Chitinophaga sp. TaxID=1869181 RepID=UPI001B2C4A06|nr:IPT/TIG domain-containing protein [Chitinophaga sp.]MBO9732955.1 IPT/TIG domain-containing protein [Chitinophaga sp.]